MKTHIAVGDGPPLCGNPSATAWVNVCTCGKCKGLLKDLLETFARITGEACNGHVSDATARKAAVLIARLDY